MPLLSHIWWCQELRGGSGTARRATAQSSAASAQKWPAGASSTVVSVQEGCSSWGFPAKGLGLVRWLGHKHCPFVGTYSAASFMHVAFCTVKSSPEHIRWKNTVCTQAPSLSPLLICVYNTRNPSKLARAAQPLGCRQHSHRRCK